MAACYAPAPDTALGFELPFDPATVECRADVWDRFLSFDPVVCAKDHVDARRALDLLYVEAGRADEVGLQVGARLLARELERLGVPHEHFAHDGGHFGLDRRYADVLPRLERALTAGD